VLVLNVPSSDRRPHWIKDNQQTAYLRVGEHSAPMGRQTFLDIATRGSTPKAQIKGLGILDCHPPGDTGAKQFGFDPLVRLERGPVTELWCMQLTLTELMGQFILSPNTPMCIKLTSIPLLSTAAIGRNSRTSRRGSPVRSSTWSSASTWPRQ
jgi:hypothetical protein